MKPVRSRLAVAMVASASALIFPSHVTARACDYGRVTILQTRRVACPSRLRGKSGPARPAESGEGGPGVFVCPPVSHNATADLAQFGAGCARWLQFALGEHAELGQTPALDSYDRAQHELERADLRCALAQAPTLGAILGVTHLALGEVSGTPTHATLSYSVYRTADRSFVGPAIKLSGSAESLRAHVPDMERALLVALHVPSTTVSSTSGLSVGDLTLLGRFPGPLESPATPQDQKALETLAQRSPVAGLVLMHHSVPKWEGVRALVINLMHQAPDNVLVLEEAAHYGPVYYKPVRDAIERNLRRSPRNYLLLDGEVTLRRSSYERDGQEALCQRAVHAAPRNTYGWLTLEGELSDQAEEIRQSRTYDLISPDESRLIEALYPRALAAAERAVALDPHYGRAWYCVASAAVFAGAMERADTALWKAAKYDDLDLYSVYDWGLQMYQPKWGGDPEKLKKVAQLAMAHHYPFGYNTRSVASDLKDAGFTAEAKVMEQRGLDQLEQGISQHPDNSDCHRQLGIALLQQPGKSADATREFETAVRLNPEDSDAHFRLGVQYEYANRFPDALTQLREVMRITPAAMGGHRDAVNCLVNANQLDAAEAEARTAIRLAPYQYRQHLMLARILEREKKLDEAVQALQELAHLYPRDFQAHSDSCRILLTEKKPEQAVSEGEIAVELEPKNALAHTLLSLAYSRSGNKDEALKHAEQGVQLDPKSVYNHLTYAYLLKDVGKKAEAQTEWKKVLELDPNGPSGKQAKEQLDKNP